MGKNKCSTNNKQNCPNINSQLYSYLTSNSSDVSILPPCSKYLDNRNPILSNCMWLFRNDNRVYNFLATSPTDLASRETTLFTNLQISFTNYIIAYYIRQVQKNCAHYDKNLQIHSNKNINNLIHQLLKNKSNLKLPFTAFIRLVVSNSSAILPLINFSEDISQLNYLIIFILHNIDKHPGLAFGNNNYILNNFVNQLLASLNIPIPFDNLKI
ncbi:hypothetical protein [Oceanirhabdus sp. W0125-5]|uniref:hypothetical protein n=1 Tax=Oceanirhabdus sp. W0125-5 TaxID=2999116 RepID=UPI0022F2FF83|nr:hypothetical protein [Oceanirhabdus sp. W0125-5]WBW95117.1 hypothetical protein OW730_15640 [Oceanirhabdus sp. W0125-5]